MQRRGVVGIVGNVLSLLAGTACCWLPLLLLAVGAVGAAGAVTDFVVDYRVAVVLAAVAILSGTAWLIYLRRDPGGC